MLVFGQTGQVARELARIAPQADYLGRDQADLAGNAGAIHDLIVARAPDAVINAAAYTAVDKAETDAATATAVNRDAVAAMAAACARLGVPFVTLSTDYVFDGSGDQPRAETAATGPLGVYGATKLAGEQAALDSGAQCAVLRTSWVFSAHGSNFVKTMLRLGAQRDRLDIVDDQIGGPTPAAALADAALRMARQMRDDPAPRGIYHLSGAPDVSWAGFARQIFARAGLSCQVAGIATTDYPTPARRPLNSRLSCARIHADFGIERPDWDAGLARVLAELGVS